MKSMFKKSRDIMLYHERNEFEEYGKAPKDYRECKICSAVYYNKSWHHGENFDKFASKKLKNLWMTRCPACKLAESQKYEGAITLENVPKKFRDELYHMIKAYAKREYDRDCQHRVIAINKEDNKTWTITTTENQLANKLAQKIKDVFNKVDVKVSYSEQPNDVERIKINFLPFWSFSQA
ncbi:hypothetical protein KGQ24_01020 [Patescibacteria group bacterium]|nr:hypothetical protein [Patescibacteria group bacterium]